jgi:hypothetical protein
VGLEEEKLEFERHKNRRDEQFWFSAATIGFNGFLLGRAEVPSLYAILGAMFVSFFAMYLVLSRWSTGAGRRPQGEPDPKTGRAVERLRYSLREMVASFGAIAYVIAELSGGCFYLLIILVSLIGVVWKNWHGFCAVFGAG